jgi:hypothetical protein
MRIRKPNRVTTSRRDVTGGRKAGRASCPRRRSRWADDTGRIRPGR